MMSIKIYRYMAAHALILIISGCTLLDNGIPTVPDLILKNQMIGSNIDVAHKRFGKPDQLTKLANGSFLAKWDSAYSYTSTTTVNELSAGPGGGTMVTPTDYKSTRNHECIISITYNSHNVITEFDTWKSDRLACNRYYNGTK